MLTRRQGICALWLLAGGTASLAGTNNWTSITRDGGSVHAMTYVTNQPGVAIAAAGYSIYRTTDNGATWSEVRPIEYSNVVMTRDPVDPGRVLIVGANSTSLITQDGGLTFSPVSRFGNGSDDYEATTGMSPDGQVWYGGTSQGRIYRSLDRGQTWEQRSVDLASAAGNAVQRIEIDPFNPQRIYILRRDTAPNVYVSNDGGIHWTLIASVCDTGCLDISLNPHAPSELLVASGTGIYHSVDNGATWARRDAGRIALVRFDPVVANRAVAVTQDNSVIRSLDDGVTWNAGFAFRTTLPGVLAFDLKVPGRIYLGASSGGFLSEDAGATWVERTNGMKANAAARLLSVGTIGRTYAIGGILGYPAVSRFDPATQQWATLGQASLDAESLDSYITTLGVLDDTPAVLYAGSIASGLLKSTDGGASWSKPSSALDAEGISSIVADPDDPGTVHVAAASGVWTSRDGGVSFPTASVVGPAYQKQLAIDPGNPQTLYVGLASVPVGTSLVYKSVNGGSTWTDISAGIDAQSVRRIKVDPSGSGIVYAATEKGLYKSTGAGASWTLLPGEGSVEDIDIDPYEPTHLIRGGSIAARHRVERSIDGGQTWERLATGMFGFSRTVAFDRTTPAAIMAATDSTIETLQVAPDLELSGISGAIAAHSSANLQLTLRNHGPFAATQVAFIANVGPPAANAQPSRGTCSALVGGIRCELGAMRVDETATIVLDLPELPIGDTVRLTLAGRQPDEDMSNNELLLNVEQRSDVAVTLVAASPNVQTGGSVAFAITASNGDLSPAEQVNVVVALPASLQWDATGASAQCTPSGQTLTCRIDSLSRFGSTQLSASARSLAAGTSIVTATIAADGTDPAPANNTASVTINVADRPAPVASSGGGGGGGGGALGWPFAFILGLLGACPRRATRAARRDNDGRKSRHP